MLRELFDRIVQETKTSVAESEKVSFVEHPLLPGAIYLNQNGERDLIEVDRETTVRHETLDSLMAAVTLAGEAIDPSSAEATDGSVAVEAEGDLLPRHAGACDLFVSLDSVTATIVSPKGERAVHVLAIEKTPAFVELLRIVDVPQPHKNMMRSLRGKLRDVVASETRNALEKIRWTSRDESESTASARSDGLGRTIERAAALATEVPEDFEVEFSPFVDDSLSRVRSRMRLLLSFDHDEQKIELQSVGDDLAKELRRLPVEIASVIHGQLGQLSENDAVPVHLAKAPSLTFGFATSLAEGKKLLAAK